MQEYYRFPEMLPAIRRMLHLRYALLPYLYSEFMKSALASICILDELRRPSMQLLRRCCQKCRADRPYQSESKLSAILSCSRIMARRCSSEDMIDMKVDSSRIDSKTGA